MTWAKPEIANSQELQFLSYDEVFVAKILSVEHIARKSAEDFSSWVAQYELVEPLLGHPPETGTISDRDYLETDCAWGLSPNSVGKTAILFIKRTGDTRDIGAMNSTTIVPDTPDAKSLLARLRSYSKQTP